MAYIVMAYIVMAYIVMLSRDIRAGKTDYNCPVYKYKTRGIAMIIR